MEIKFHKKPSVRIWEIINENGPNPKLKDCIDAIIKYLDEEYEDNQRGR